MDFLEETFDLVTIELFKRQVCLTSIFEVFLMLRIIGNILPLYFDNGSFMNVTNVNDPDIRTQINNGTLNYDDLIFLPMQTQFRGNKDGFLIDGETSIAPVEIETVDSYEIGLKKLFYGNLF